MYYAILAFSIVLGIFEMVCLIQTYVYGMRCSSAVQGTVSNITEIAPGKPGLFGRRPYRRYLVEYSYTCNGTDYKMHGISRVRTPKCSIGDSEQIMCDPKKPERSYSWFDRVQIVDNNLVAIALLVVAALILYYI